MTIATFNWNVDRLLLSIGTLVGNNFSPFEINLYSLEMTQFPAT
jgi:hypothetical protein